MSAHRLRREIITTSLVNEMVDTGGSTFLFRMGEETGLPVPDITRAWLVAREVFDMPAFWRQLGQLAGQVDVEARIAAGPRGAQARGAGHPVAADEQAAAVRYRGDGELSERGSRDGTFRQYPSCCPAAI